jgi:hypothetical protein
MCSSTAILLYGIWVTSASLDIAATAHARVQRVSHAIDLILLRRRLGTLEAEKEGARVSRVPGDAWEMVKKELLPMELRRAERDELDEYRCKRCERKDRERAVAAGELSKGAAAEDVDIKHDWNTWQMPKCKDFRRNVEKDGYQFFRSPEVRRLSYAPTYRGADFYLSLSLLYDQLDLFLRPLYAVQHLLERERRL